MHRKKSAVTIRQQKGKKKIIATTAYDYTFARLVDDLVDIVLVGDSLGMVIQGHSDTLSVTVDDMVYHTRAVARACKSAHVIGDMPFMSYQASAEDAIRSAGRLLAEGNAEAVKLEGGAHIAPVVEKVVEVGIPVMGHIGLTPQSVRGFGGFKIQGRSEDAQKRILEDAKALEAAGAYSIVLEGIPATLAEKITNALSIPTIGIGAGASCDGQVLVIQDLLGLNTDFKPSFVKPYANLGETVRHAFTEYVSEVEGGKFPGEEHSF